MNESEIKAKVEKIIIKNDDIQRKRNESTKKSSKNAKNKEQFVEFSKDVAIHETFPIKIEESSFTIKEYSLRSSWILDHGFDIHVVNDCMQHRFIKERDCINEFIVAAENELLSIKAYEKIIINIQTIIEDEKDIILLINVAYISNFMINIVFESILEEKKLHFDIEHRHLHRKKKAIFFAPKMKNHYVIKNNIKSIANVFIAKIDPVTKFETAYKWHQLFVHTNSEIIEHFTQVTERVKIIEFIETIFKINKCEVCALAKAHKLIFRIKYVCSKWSHWKKEKHFINKRESFTIWNQFINLFMIMNSSHCWIHHE